jgi:Alkylmercury lyase
MAEADMKGQPPATPVVPDWTVVTDPAARQAIDGILSAGHYDSRFGGIDPGPARVLVHLLRLYARLGHAPMIDDIAGEAGVATSDVKRRLADLRMRDLVLLDPAGDTILGAYPFTEAATGHSITFAGTGRTLATMCAIDALGAGAMCRDDVTIRSVCRACGGDVVARTRRGGMALGQIEPTGAVAWVGLRQSCGCAADTLCTELLLFCSDEHLVRWNKGRSHGHRLTPEEAFQVGKALFIDRAMMGRV